MNIYLELAQRRLNEAKKGLSNLVEKPATEGDLWGVLGLIDSAYQYLALYIEEQQK